MHNEAHQLVEILFQFYLIRACVCGRAELDRWHSRAQWSMENRETFGITVKHWMRHVFVAFRQSVVWGVGTGTLATNKVRPNKRYPPHWTVHTLSTFRSWNLNYFDFPSEAAARYCTQNGANTVTDIRTESTNKWVRSPYTKIDKMTNSFSEGGCVSGISFRFAKSREISTWVWCSTPILFTFTIP